MICKVSQDEAIHAEMIGVQDVKDSDIESLATHYYDELKAGKFITANGNQYHIDDFIADLEIDPFLLSEVIRGNSTGLSLFMIESLNYLCFKHAKEELL